MKIYNKYIIVNLFKQMFTTVFTIIFVVWSIRILKFTYLIPIGGLWNFLRISFYIIMPVVLIISPLILFITTILIYEKMITSRELIILRCSGLTNYQLSKPSIILSLVVMLFSYIISLYILPNSYYNIQKVKNDIFSNISFSLIKDNSFVELQNTTIYVDKKDNENLKNVLLYNSGQKYLLVQAKEAIISNNGNIKLLNGTIQQMNAENQIPFMTFFDEYIVNINNFIEKKDNSFSEKIDSIPTIKLLTLFFAKNNLIFSELVILKELSYRFFYPLLCIIITLLSCVLILNFPFNRNSNTKMLLKTMTISTSMYMVMYFLILKINSNIMFFYIFLLLLISVIIFLFFSLTR